ncbi:MAG: rhomboid family intramembrane serine protease [Dehalococcoidales bacterium]|nr:rhomboid family intramembrane serine protease [Dehalococcoidales bacterium]
MSGFSLNPVLVIIVINFVFYIATLINSNILVNLGVIPAMFTERPWTILTAMFVHSGFLHLLGNMFVLYFFGRAIYQLVGSNKFLLVYFVGGVLGNLLYALLGEPLSIAIGASGAVYAVAGALVMIVPRLTVRLYFFIPMPLWVVILIFFVAWSFIPGLGIAWQAHIGGLVVGLVAGYFFRKKIGYIVYR